jgi:hypothetical protein
MRVLRATRLFPGPGGLQLERDFVRVATVRAPDAAGTAISLSIASRSSLGLAKPCRARRTKIYISRRRLPSSYPTAMTENLSPSCRAKDGSGRREVWIPTAFPPRPGALWLGL